MRTAACSLAYWDELVASSPAATAFHDARFLEAFSRLQGWRLELRVVLDDRRPVGAVPLVLVRRGPLWSAAVMPFPYVGPLVEERHLAGAILAVARWSGSRGVLANRLDLRLPTSAQLRELDRAGVDTELQGTWIVGLTDGASPSDSFHRNYQRGLRAARRAGVTTEPVDLATTVEVLPRLLAEAYPAHGAANPYGFLDAAGWRRLVASHEGAATTGAFLDGRCVGVLVGLRHRSTVYLWLGGCLREARPAYANVALHAAVLEDAAAVGCTSVDLVGEVDAGVARFKAGLGARRATFAVGMRPTALGRFKDGVLHAYTGIRRASPGRSGVRGDGIAPDVADR